MIAQILNDAPSASWAHILGEMRREFPRHKFGYTEKRSIIRPNWWRRWFLGQEQRLGPAYGVIAVIGPYYSIDACTKLHELAQALRPIGVELKLEMYGE